MVNWWKLYVSICSAYRDYRRGGGATHSSPVQQQHKFVVPVHGHHHLIPTTLGAHQFASFSSGGPPPAHQSPRHIPYATHPLPAHLHPVLPSPSLHPAAAAAAAAGYTTQLQHQITGPTYVNSPPSGSIYATYPLSPTKARQMPYLYQTFAGEWRQSCGSVGLLWCWGWAKKTRRWAISVQSTLCGQMVL